MHKGSLTSREFRELLLSHHPNTKKFNDDITLLFGKRVCTGCLLAYPLALLTLVILHPTGSESIYASVGLAVVSQLRRFIKDKQAGYLFRAIAGIALGLGIGGLLWALDTKNYFLTSVVVIGGIGYAAARAYSINKRLTE